MSQAPMMAIMPIARREQAEEKKHIANVDAVSFQMRLRRARLTEGPTPIQQHRVFVAQIVGTDAPLVTSSTISSSPARW
jgi:hypothetical protein